MRLTDHNGFFQFAANDPSLPRAVQNRLNLPWLSNRDLIELDANLTKPGYDICAQTDRFFVFDAIHERRTTKAEVDNPLSLRNVPALGNYAEYNLAQLASWHGRASLLAGSVYYGILNHWDGSFTTTPGDPDPLQTNLTALLLRLNANALLAPRDRNDLIAFVVMNALFRRPPGGAPLAVGTLVLPLPTGTPLVYAPVVYNSPIGMGDSRSQYIQAARTYLASQGLVLAP